MGNCCGAFDNVSSLGQDYTGANSVCFTKNWVNIGVFPNATPSCKFWKNSPEDQNYMGGAGKENKNALRYFKGKRAKTKRKH